MAEQIFGQRAATPTQPQAGRPLTKQVSARAAHVVDIRRWEASSPTRFLVASTKHWVSKGIGVEHLEES